mgnify:CR=1 FL=1
MSAVPRPRQPLRMVVVGGSNVMRRRIERSQQNDALEVVGTAVNGLDAVTKFKQLLPDVMTLDLTMPEMDGYATMREIRKDPRFGALPMLALTAKAMKGDREKCLEAGASDYIAKPVNTEQLLSLLRVWLYR